MDAQNVLVFLAAVQLVCATANAEDLRQCMEKEMTRRADVQTIEVLKDQGCTTAPTVFVDNMTSFGFRVDTCQVELRWKALPGRVITDARISGSSGGGSRYEFAGPTFVPDRTRAVGVCVHVEARGFEGEVVHSSGWQKISLTVTTRHVATEAEMVKIAVECVEADERPGSRRD